MRHPTIKVSAVALIGLLSFSLTSCRTGSGNQNAQSSPAASASGNGTQGSAQSEASPKSSPTSSTQSATANAEDRGVTPTLGRIPQGGNPPGGYRRRQRDLGEFALWKYPLLVC